MLKARWSRVAGTGLIVATTMVASLALDSATAGAKDRPGTIDCTGLIGTLKFSPPLTNTVQSVTMTGRVTMHNDNCQVTAGSASWRFAPHASPDYTISKSSVTADLSCADLTGAHFPASVTWSTKWTYPGRTSASVATFSGLVGSSTSGTITLMFPGRGGKVSTTGSYTGDDLGTSSTESLNLGSGPMTTGCSAGGVKKLTVGSGAFFSG
jgi:hypothetical protein